MSALSRLAPLTAYVLIAAAYVLSGWRESPIAEGPFHHYQAQAQAFLAGRLDLLSYPPNVEMGFHNDRAYVVLPPGPAVALMPLVGVFGSRINMVPVHALLSAGSVVLLLGAMRKRGVASWTAWLCAMAFGFGTVLWWLTKEMGPWHTAQVMSAFCLCLALRLDASGRAAWAVGFLVGFSAISRQLTILAAPYFLYRVLSAHGHCEPNAPPATTIGNRLVRVAALLFGLAIPLSFYLWLNWARFGNPFETGYRFINLGPPGLDKYLAHGLFSAAYLPENVFTLLFAPPRWGNEFPYFFPDYFGQAIVFTSPFVFYAFRAGAATRERKVLWLCCLGILIPQLFYFNNGYAQFGYRFALDFLPLAMLLVANGLGPKPSWCAIATVFVAVLMNMLGVCML